MMYRLVLPLTLVAILWSCADPASNEPIGVLRSAGVEVGKEAPNIALPDSTGKLVNLRDYKGKVVYIDFWASWCKPCTDALPELKQLWQEYQDKDFVILGVSLDNTEAAWESYIVENEMDWVNAYEAPRAFNRATEIYGILAIPQTFLVDKNGIIVAHNIHSLDEQLQREVIDGYLEE